MTLLKSIGAVLAGFLTVVLLSTGTDWVLEHAGLYPAVSSGVVLDTWMLALALAYRTLYTVLGGYVTAQLAPERPKRHVYILAVLGTLGGIAGVFAGWNLSAHWYPIALAVLAFPSVWFGGWLRIRTSGAAIDAGPSAWKPIADTTQEITISRMFDANRQKVWEAWTKPQYLSQWWGVPPLAATAESTSIDLKVGGRWQADMVNAADGSILPFRGKYLEINAPTKLVFTIEDPQNPDNPNFETVTISLKDHSGTTQMILNQKGHLPPDQYGEPLRKGYTSFFERMIFMLQQMR